MFFRSGRWRCAKVPSFLARNRHFTQGCQVNRMTDYANVELANKHSAYKTADCSGQQRNTCMRNDIPRDVIPVIISLEAFTRCQIRQIISNLARIPTIEQNVLQQVQETPNTRIPQSKDSSRAAFNPKNRFQNEPIIAQVKGPKFKPKQRRVAFNHMVFPPAL